MQNVLLIVHLILAVFLIGVVLLQRSEGGALGIGGGGGSMAGRTAITPLAKVTWFLGAAFIATSITLTVLAGGRDDGDPSVVVPDAGAPEGIDLLPPPSTDAGADDLLPPPSGSSAGTPSDAPPAE